MGRVIAIDYGTKRVGLAVTDPLKIIATPLDTIHAKDISSFLSNYTKTESVEKFVVGYPVSLKGEATNNTPHVVGFIRQLKKQFPDIPVIEVDERFTSSMALNAMIEGGMKKKDRKEKGNVDKISATIILQTYLETKVN